MSVTAERSICLFITITTILMSALLAECSESIEHAYKVGQRGWGKYSVTAAESPFWRLHCHGYYESIVVIQYH